MIACADFVREGARTCGKFVKVHVRVQARWRKAHVHGLVVHLHVDKVHTLRNREMEYFEIV